MVSSDVSAPFKGPTSVGHGILQAVRLIFGAFVIAILVGVAYGFASIGPGDCTGGGELGCGYGIFFTVIAIWGITTGVWLLVKFVFKKSLIITTAILFIIYIGFGSFLYYDRTHRWASESAMQQCYDLPNDPSIKSCIIEKSLRGKVHASALATICGRYRLQPWDGGNSGPWQLWRNSHCKSP